MVCASPPSESSFREQGLGGRACVLSSIAEMVPYVDALAILCPNHARVQVMEDIVAAVKSTGTSCAALPVRNRFAAIWRGPSLTRLLAESMCPEPTGETRYLRRHVFHSPANLQVWLPRWGRQCCPAQLKSMRAPHAPWFWDPSTGGGVLSDIGLPRHRSRMVCPDSD